MANRDFFENRNINEGNSLLDLVQNISPYSGDEVNFTDHSIYYNDQNYKECIVLYCIVLYCIVFMRPYTDGPIGPLSYRHSSGVVRNPHSTLAK